MAKKTNFNTKVTTRICLVSLFFGAAHGACGAAPAGRVEAPATSGDDATEEERQVRAFLEANYAKAEHQIPMRDGARLHTAVYSPRDTSTTYPIVLLRTPYSCEPYGDGKFPTRPFGGSDAMTREKFIFVYQDVRGKFMSDGQFVNMRPHVAKKESSTDVDESSDAYDTIDWLVKNVPNNNGRVGVWGISYPGFYAGAAAIDAHPALVAVSPQAPIADWYFDDFHHHGAFLTLHAFGFMYVFDPPRREKTTEWPDRFVFPVSDAFDFFQRYVKTSASINKTFYKDAVPFWKDVVAHPDYDDFWQARNILPHYGKLGPAVMTVGGWYDAEDLYGTFATYRALEDKNPDGQNTIVVGPWVHGGWVRTDGTSLGEVTFTDDPSPSDYYRDKLALPFFVHHLKGVQVADPPEATMFETGTNRWRQFDSWPPPERVERTLYLSEIGRVSWTAPAGAGFDEFVSDPARPVPYTQKRGVRMNKEYMVEDQRFASRRPDVLVYQSEPLTADLTVAGPIPVDLRVSTTGTDADWIVKLIDVHPDMPVKYWIPQEEDNAGGMEQMVRSEVFRGRYRNSYEVPEPFVPGQTARIRFPLQDVLHTFKKGHRIMVQVHSTWFPLVDRNPQTFVENIFQASPEDFTVATHRVYRSAAAPSSLTLGVLP